ncbi:carbonyl reductase 2 [Cricetulus griseus]|uniref:Carbonyl reductase 2 n=1 Tax=Cricetulus griseus TaxID=10029 RepID=A0A061HZE2_CRIGR|nr:carbonyl reductase 2 [Cricetulus griseus]
MALLRPGRIHLREKYLDFVYSANIEIELAKYLSSFNFTVKKKKDLLPHPQRPKGICIERQLDIDHLQSIRALRDFLLKEYGGLDVLISNAGIAFKNDDPTPFYIQAEVTMKTNFFGTQDVSIELLPLIKPKGRVVNVSRMESLRALKNCSPELQQKFQNETTTQEELVGLMDKFVEDTKKGMHEKEGWPNSAYEVTKIGVTVLSRIHARKLSQQRRGDKILLNA